VADPVDPLIERHRRACDGFARVADAVPVDRWTSPSPCTEWDARAVVEHVIGFHEILLLGPMGVRAHRPRDDEAARSMRPRS
jgi:mycothiol maleylpyruvate isomerase-like protein